MKIQIIPNLKSWFKYPFESKYARVYDSGAGGG